ncbi:hypothetical protein D3C80_1044780 [compost metagenome]
MGDGGEHLRAVVEKVLELGLRGVEGKDGLAQVVRADYRYRWRVEVLAKAPRPFGETLQRLGEVTRGKQRQGQAGGNHQRQNDQVARQFIQPPAAVARAIQQPRLVRQFDQQGIPTLLRLRGKILRSEDLDLRIRALQQRTQGRRAFAKLAIGQGRQPSVGMPAQPLHAVGRITRCAGQGRPLRRRRGVDHAGDRGNLVDQAAFQQRRLRPHTEQHTEQPLEQQQAKHGSQGGECNPAGDGDPRPRQRLAHPGKRAHRLFTPALNR